MIFEVDNTTEHLINDLEQSFESIIQTLHKGQEELKDEIEHIKRDLSLYATASQMEEVSELISKMREKTCDFSTKEQINGIHTVLNHLNGASDSFLKKLDDELEISNKIIYKIEESKLDALNKLQSTLFEYDQKIDSLEKIIYKKIGELDEQYINILSMSTCNDKMLKKISTYLSLPGYKRFFKGMETDN